jgi:hypothetical protein
MHQKFKKRGRRKVFIPEISGDDSIMVICLQEKVIVETTGGDADMKIRLHGLALYEIPE